MKTRRAVGLYQEFTHLGTVHFTSLCMYCQKHKRYTVLITPICVAEKSDKKSVKTFPSQSSGKKDTQKFGQVGAHCQHANRHQKILPGSSDLKKKTE